MGSSAQNSSGVHWCRSRVRFNGVPEKVPDKVWEALVQSQVRLNRIPEKVPEKVWESLVQSQVRFNRVSGDFGAEPHQVQQDSGEGSGEGSREGLGGLGAEPRQVQQGFRRRFRRKFGRLWCSTGFQRRFRRRSGRVWCRARSGSTGFRREGSGAEKAPEKVWETLVQSHVSFNRVPEKEVWCRATSGSTGFRSGAEPRQAQQGSREGSGEGLGGFGAEPGQVQRVSGEGSGEGSGRRGGEPGQVQRGSGEGSGEGSGRVLVWPGSTRLQVGSGAIPGVCSSKFRTKQLWKSITAADGDATETYFTYHIFGGWRTP